MKIIRMYKMGVKRYLLLALVVFSIIACSNKDTLLTKVVLVSNIEKTEQKQSLDSIVFLYNFIQKDNIYISQDVHIGNNKQSFNYYLYNKDNLIYLGIEINNDSIIYYPYYSLTLHDTIRYDISYLDDINGFTVLIKDIEPFSKEYKGNIAFLNFEEAPSWVLDKDFKMERIQLGNLIFDKIKEENVMKYPDNYQKPIVKSIDVFMPPSREYFFKSIY